MSFCSRVENIGLSLDSFLLFVIGNHNISLFLDLDGKPFLTTFGVKSRGYYGNGKSYLLVHSFNPLLTDDFYFIHVIIFFFLVCFVVFEGLDLESLYQGRVQVTLKFACEIDDFDDLVDPCRLYYHCLRPEPTEYVLKKILREEKSMCIDSFPFFFTHLKTYFFL